MGQEWVYNLLRGLHLIGVIAWMAGLLFLPRLYVYHMKAQPGSDMDQLFKDAERRMLRIILNPAMILTLIFGLGLIVSDGERRGWGFLATPWMVTKLAGVVFLLGWHGFLSGARRTFEAGTNARSERFWRMTNELPFVAAVIMVLAVTTEFGG